MQKEINIGRIGKFPDFRTTAVDVEGRSVCVARVGKMFYAFGDTCSHEEAPLSGLDIEEGMISCPRHGARFSVANGQALTPPATEPLTMFKIATKGEDVFITI